MVTFVSSLYPLTFFSIQIRFLGFQESVNLELNNVYCTSLACVIEGDKQRSGVILFYFIFYTELYAVRPTELRVAGVVSFRVFRFEGFASAIEKFVPSWIVPSWNELVNRRSEHFATLLLYFVN